MNPSIIKQYLLQFLIVVARWRTVAKWADIARRHRFDREEFCNLVKALDLKEKSKVFAFYTDSKQVADKVKFEEDKRHTTQIQPEAFDQYLEEVKRRPRGRALLRQTKIEETEEVKSSYL